jgi:hypothetical protein
LFAAFAAIADAMAADDDPTVGRGPKALPGVALAGVAAAASVGASLVAALVTDAAEEELTEVTFLSFRNGFTGFTSASAEAPCAAAGAGSDATALAVALGVDLRFAFQAGTGASAVDACESFDSESEPVDLTLATERREGRGLPGEDLGRKLCTTGRGLSFFAPATSLAGSFAASLDGSEAVLAGSAFTAFCTSFTFATGIAGVTAPVPGADTPALRSASLSGETACVISFA